MRNFNTKNASTWQKLGQMYKFLTTALFLGSLLLPFNNCSEFHARNANFSGLQSSSNPTPATTSTGSASASSPSDNTSQATAATSTCRPPVSPINTSNPDIVVGTGTPASCTQAALVAAVAHGGVITFNCGGTATIAITSEIKLNNKVDTTIDGDGVITLDGQNKARIFYFDGGCFQSPSAGCPGAEKIITLQNLTFQNAKSSGTLITAPPTCSQGYETDGGGGAIYVRDGTLHVINSQFINNQGAELGPDVGGGAIYLLGNTESVISGCTFTGNSASNGGAIGSLWGNLRVYNSVFKQNSAMGSGANTINSSVCTVPSGDNGIDGEVGNGGNGGAIVIDGGENYTVTVCGSQFLNNKAGTGALGGAIFRTPDSAMQSTNIDLSTFDGNTATSGGALYFHNSNLSVTDSTLSNNTAQSGGALFTDGSNIRFVNDTLYKNVASKGLGGAIVIWGNSGTLTNVTLDGNESPGGSGLFGGAVAGSVAVDSYNTLFVDNTTNDCGSPMQCEKQGTGGPNLQWPQTHLVCQNIDPACTAQTKFQNPELSSTLAENGGPTMTILPLPGSPAIGIGTNCPATDQRGRPRPSSGCTLGAVEGSN